MLCIFDAPTPKAASLILGGTDCKEALAAIMITGKVISAKTKPPTNGAERGIPA